MIDISSISSTFSSSDISYLEGILTSSNIDQKKFEQILKEISEESKEIEKNYTSHNRIFPEHNFNKIAIENVLEKIQNEQIESASSSTDPIQEVEKPDASNNTSVKNETSDVAKNESPKDNKNADSKSIDTSSSKKTASSLASSDYPSLNNVRNTKYDSIIKEMSNKYDVPFDLIKSVINAESSFDPTSTSKTGAMGLMQLMPSTAKWLGVDNAYNAKQNIEGGTKYLSYLLDKFNNNLKLSVAAYNAGPGNVTKYKGIPPFQETQKYVKKILG
ncbi:lytic transglycosylase domain-containing protein [Bacillus mexicanus]|uniref:lytic transglycosylase domain-containing protein n=1 Tax=Bacillus mexicanus TaxID=2834415 RepID=UPI003D1EAE76